MSAELLLQIKSTIEEITELSTIKKHFDQTSSDLDQAFKDLQILDKQLDKELRDVENMEGLSIKSIFYQVLGSKEDQIEKERQEYLQINLKHKEHKKMIELLEFEKKVLSGKVEDLKGKITHLENLKSQRADLLIASQSSKGIQLKIILESIDKLHQKRAEIEQAQKAGNASLQSLTLVKQHLKKAETWGNWDMTNQGRHYDHMKHSSIDRAIDEAYRSKHLLTIFKNELADVNHEKPDFDLVVDTFNKFTDIFFDNLISDWLVQQKIENVLKNVTSVSIKVTELLKKLNEDDVQSSLEIEKLSLEKDQILTT